MESSFKNRNIETMFARILGKLERIEEKLDETSYPPEEAFNSDFVERVNTADNEIIKGKRLEFESMDDFLSSIEK
ncbi:MAG: hypothetical protein K8R08_07515 [Methanosarcinales archaeon]|jgi:type VI protein secretion system component VasF|nr:hypothetical protein [Methanosarcinales archaeon]